MATERQSPFIEGSGSAVAVGGGSDTTNHTPYPTITAADDGKIVVLAFVDGSESDTPLVEGDTWTNTNFGETGELRVGFYWNIIDGTESGNIAVSGIGSGDSVICRAFLLSLCDTVDGEGQEGPTADKNPADASVTTTGDERLVLSITGINDGETASSFTSETGGDWTLFSNDTSDLGDDVGVSLQEALLASSGTINGGTWSYGGATEWWATIAKSFYAAVLPTLVQDSFRIKDDVGGETDATWLAALNTDVEVALDTNFRPRFLIKQTDSNVTPGHLFAGSGTTDTPELEWRVDTGGGYGSWTQVPPQNDTTQPVRFSLSSQFTGANTTQQIGSGNFVGGRIEEIGPDLGFLPADLRLRQRLEEFEYEACLTFDSSNTTPAAEGDKFQFRFLRMFDSTDQLLDTYTNTPTITVASDGDVTLVLGGGAFAFDGTAAVLKVDRQLVLGGGALAFDGAAVGLVPGFSLALDSGALAFDGSAVSLIAARQLLLGGGALAFAGTAVGFTYNTPLPLAGGAFAFDGSDVGLTADFQLVLGAGALAFDGTAVGLVAARPLVLGAGAFAFDGTAVGFTYNTPLPLAGGAFAFDGTALTLVAAHQLVMEAGAFGFAGTALDLQNNNEIALGGGAFAFDGTAVDLIAARQLVLGGGALAFDGSAVSLVAGRQLVMGIGAFAFDGTNLDLIAARQLVMGAGAFAFDGADVGLLTGGNFDLTLDSGAFAFDGTDVGLLHYELALGAGAFAFDGTAVTLTNNNEIALGGGVLAFDGSALGLTADHQLVLGGGVLAFDGSAVGLVAGRQLVMGAGALAFDGSALGLIAGHQLVIGGGAFAFDGTALTLKADFQLVLGIGAFAFDGSDLTLTFVPVSAFIPRGVFF